MVQSVVFVVFDPRPRMNWASQPTSKPNKMIPKMSTRARYRSG
jgi:hypothetical protein